MNERRSKWQVVKKAFRESIKVTKLQGTKQDVFDYVYWKNITLKVIQNYETRQFSSVILSSYCFKVTNWSTTYCFKFMSKIGAPIIIFFLQIVHPHNGDQLMERLFSIIIEANFALLIKNFGDLSPNFWRFFSVISTLLKFTPKIV